MAQTRTTRPRVGTTRAQQGRPKGPVITFMGKEYRISEKQGIWPLMKFARAAELGETVRDMKGLASLHAMCENVIHPDDWAQFDEDMIAAKVADPMEFLDLANQAVEIIQAATAKAAASNGKGPVRDAIARG